MLPETQTNFFAQTDEAKNVSLCPSVVEGHGLVFSSIANALNFRPAMSFHYIHREFKGPEVP